MGKKGFLVLCGALVCSAMLCVPALVAHAIPEAPAPESQAAHDQAVANDYVGRFQKAYDQAKAAKTGADANRPPIDIIALTHAITQFQAANDACSARNSDKTSARIQCWLTATRQLTRAGQLQDSQLFDAFSTTMTGMATDADVGFVSSQQALRSYSALLTMFDRISLVELQTYLAGPAKTAPGAPFDAAAIAGADDVVKDARDNCNGDGTQPNTVFVDCLLAADAAFDSSIKLTDPAMADKIAAILKQAAIDADADKLSHVELKSAYASLESLYRSALDQRYNSWVAEGYERQFTQIYADAKAKKPGGDTGPLYDPTAVTAATAARETAYTACGIPAPGKPATAVLQCYLDANAAYDAATKMRDKDLGDTYRHVMQAAAADADAGKITQGQLLSVWQTIDRDFDLKFMAENNDAQAKIDKPIVDAYVARFNQAYAAATANRAAPDGPPFDTAAAAVASDTLKKAEKQCLDESEALKTRTAWMQCHLDAFRTYETSVKMNDMDLVAADAAGALAVSKDADAGTITQQQWEAVLSALDTAFNNKVRANNLAYANRINKPVADAYVARFDKEYAAAQSTRGKPAADGPPFNAQAMAATPAQTEKANADCRARDSEFKTYTARMECYLAPILAGGAAAKVRDMALYDAYAATERAAAADADAGKITQSQLASAYSAIATVFLEHTGKEYADYQAMTLKPLADTWSQRFDAEYAQLEAARTPSKAPSYDGRSGFLASAQADRNKALALCNSRQAELKTALAIRNCSLDVIKAYHAAIKWQDTPLDDALFDVQRAAAADADAGKLTPEQLTAILIAIGSDYDKHVAKIDSDYMALTNGPLIASWSQTYDRNYLALSKNAVAANDAPYDGTAQLKAVAARTQSYNLCAAERAELKTTIAQRNCYLDADKTYAATIELQDMALYDAYAQTTRAAAADLDAGKIGRDLYAGIISAVETNYDGRRQRQLSAWLLKTYKPVADAWTGHYDRQYLQAGPMVFAADDNVPPYDAGALAQAEKDRRTAFQHCVERRGTEFKTQTPFTQCELDADKIYAATFKLRDMALFQAYAASDVAAAADLDSGKLTEEQFGAAMTAIDNDYRGRLVRQYADWRNQQNKPISDVYVARFDKDYAQARASAGPLPADVAPMDEAAMHQAQPALEATRAACTANRPLTSQSQYMDCYLGALKTYYVQAKLQDMALFDAYARLLMQVSADTTANKLTLDQSRSVDTAITEDLEARIKQENAEYLAGQKHASAN